MSAGFEATISARLGSQKAGEAVEEALGAIRAALPSAKTFDMYRYLASEYGTKTAQEVLAGRPVALQLETRLARFLRHFEEVKRRAR